jgi:hypothetical protein
VASVVGTLVGPTSRRAAARNIHASGDSVNPRWRLASHDENVCATAFLNTVATVAWIGFGAVGAVTTVGVAVTESWVVVIVSVSVVVALVRDDSGASSAGAPPLEVCARVDDFGRGAGSDDTAVSERFVPLRDALCDAVAAGAGETSGTSACPVVPSPASSSVVGPLSGVGEWAPPECDTVTPGPTSTVVDEPASVSDVGDVDGPGDESSDLSFCAAGAPSWADVEPAGVAAEAAVSLAPSEVPSAAGLPVDGESLAVSGFALAIPAGAAMADPMPNATARAPIRPT